MGMRQNIKMEYSDGNSIYIYSHWGGGETIYESSLHLSLYYALACKKRWDDESYLARIIISEVPKEDIDGHLDFGISPYPFSAEYPTIEVDLKNNTVNDLSFQDFIDSYSFWNTNRYYKIISLLMHIQAYGTILHCS